MSIDTQENPRPAEKLASVRVGLREDIEISRHTFRGRPAYIARDPITFQSQRLDPEDYAIWCRIASDRSLQATFEALVSEGRLSQDDEDRFYEFILSLHTLGFLRLPVSDDRMLFRRHMLREQMRRREKLSNILFFRIPVWNPDAFLDRTINVVRPLLSPYAFAGWVLLLISAVYLAIQNWHDLIDPLAGILVAENLMLMWVTLVGLKVIHEFGHAYVCKHYGGHVPEMGIFLILFTPCAYVDATASWGFTSKRHRLFVSLAGMYVEMAMASVAVLVWATTGPSLINSIAHNAIFLASAVTVLFNVNPLMRYDGYYILCDLLEIPNLRARSAHTLLAQTKRLLLGIAPPEESGGKRLTAILCGFGVATALYRISILIAITAVLASKMFVVGLIFGAVMIVRTIISLGLRMTKYLWYAEETVTRRVRAVAISLLLLLILPAGVMWLPVQNQVQIAGVTRRSEETVVRAAVSGFVTQVCAEPGQSVADATPLAHLENLRLQERLTESEAELRASRIRTDAYRLHRPEKWVEEQAVARVTWARHEQLNEQMQRLTVRAGVAGDVVASFTDSDVGRYVREGDPIATVGSGPLHVRALLTEEQLVASAPTTGTPISFRAANDPGRLLTGHIVQIVPSGSHIVTIEALTHLGGRGIAVDPTTHRARIPYFEITAVLTGAPTSLMRIGMTGEMQLEGKREPLGMALVRRVKKFWNRLRRT